MKSSYGVILMEGDSSISTEDQKKLVSETDAEVIVISDYVNGVQLEMKKVTWLSKEEMLGSTMIVGIFSVLIAIFLFFVDFGLSEFISRILGGK